MTAALFNPFEPLSFGQDICFLTGQKLDESNKHLVSAFPTWVLERYNLGQKNLVMLDYHQIKYKDLLLPASKEVAEAVNNLDKITQKAFEEGYEAVIKLPELTLFQWMARVMYGVLYQDFTYVISQHKKTGENLEFNSLTHQKVKNLHFMLQSLVRPIVFNGFKPWSMRVYRINISKDIFNYKDETRNLNFCLMMNDFGIASSLQDNESVANYNIDVLNEIGNATLHPAQFEELYARFIYTNYIMRNFDDYTLTQEDETIVFTLADDTHKAYPRFSAWVDETFAQVLANFWKPWGITITQIHTPPNSPISYLINEVTREFIKPEEITLPY